MSAPCYCHSKSLSGMTSGPAIAVSDAECTSCRTAVYGSSFMIDPLLANAFFEILLQPGSP